MQQTSAPVVDPYSAISAEFLQNPYPTYSTLRQQAPILHNAEQRRWLISSYSAANAVLRDLRFSSQRYDDSARKTEDGFQGVRSTQSNWMLMKDQPDHTRLRTLVNKAFTPSTVESLRPHMISIVDQLLDEMAAEGKCDLMKSYAFPLPVTVIAAMLGVPNQDHAKFSRWSRALLGASDVQQNPQRFKQANEAVEELRDYFRAMVALRKQTPREDLLTALVQAEEAGSKLSTDEVLDNCIMLLFAGHETTVNLIGNGMYALLRHPQQFQKLNRQPELIKTAVDELLRYDSPVQYTRRMVKEDFEFQGHHLSKSEMVIAIIGSANRDPEQFSNPDELDLERQDNKHLAFGTGIHYCLGASLARVEAELAFSSIVQRFPQMKLSGEQPIYRDSAGFRGLESLSVLL